MKFLDYLFLMRPMLIIPVWTIALLGARAANWQDRGLQPFVLDQFPFADFLPDGLKILLMLALAKLLVGGVYIINQIYDRESDRKNRKLFLLADGHLSTTPAWALYFSVTAVAITGSFLLSWQLGILFVAGALLGLQYSHPALKIRSNPYKSFRNNIVAHGSLAFLFGWVLFHNFNLEGILKSIPYMLAVGAVYLYATLPDTEGDKETGKRTYATEWGASKTLKIAFYYILLSLVASIAAADYALSISAAISLPFSAIAWRKESVRHGLLTTRLAILALSLFAAIYYPIYLAMLVGTIAITRVYYAKRFRISYPALIGDLK